MLRHIVDTQSYSAAGYRLTYGQYHKALWFENSPRSLNVIYVIRYGEKL